MLSMYSPRIDQPRLLMKVDQFDLHFDGNGPTIIADSTKTINQIISQLAEVIKDVWAPNTPRMTFKNYVQQILFAGDKRDEKIKALQEAEVSNFLNKIKEMDAKAKEENPIYQEGIKAAQEDDIANFLIKYKELQPSLYDQAVSEVEKEIDSELNKLIENNDPIYEEAKVKMQNHKYKEKMIFKAFLNNLGYPLYKKTMYYYNELVANYVDPKTQKIKFKIFPAVIELVKELRKMAAITFTTRTFGKDGPVIGKGLTEVGIPMTQSANMTPNGMILKGTQTEITGEAFLETIEQANTIGQDDFDWWSKKNKEQAACSKIVLCVKDALFKGRIRVAVFFDDNLKTNNNPYPDPTERNIGFPKDIYGRNPVSWNNDPGIIGIKVNPAKAAIDKFYYIKKLNRELIKRGINPIQIE